MSDKYEPMTAQQRANVQSIIDLLGELGDKTGDYTTKTDARQTGASHHFKFERKVDVMTTVAFINAWDQCPMKLISACEKLLWADERVAELLKAEAS